MVACIIDLLRRAGICRVRKEDKRCFDGAAAITRPNLSMDIVVPLAAIGRATDPNIRTKRVLIDVTVPNPSGKTAIQRHRTDLRAGAAAAARETHKQNHYSRTFVAATSHLVPFAVETYGRIGKEGEHFLRELSMHAGGSDGFVPRNQIVSKWRQLVSVSLQCALSRRELMYVQGLRVREARAVRPIEQMWDMVEGHADATAAATGGGYNRGPRTA